MNIIDEVDQALPKLTIKSMNPKGSHGLHQVPLKLQTMTALIKSFCGGPGGSFYKKRPLAVGDNK